MTKLRITLGFFLLLMNVSTHARAERLVLASASYGKNIIAICDAQGKVLWSHQTGGPKSGHAGHHDIQLLDNGNLLFHDNWTTVVEMTLDKKVVWTYDSSTMNGNKGKAVEVHAFRRLPSGLTMIAESGVGRIIEVDKDGTIHAEVKLQPGGRQHTRMARKLDSGNYLVCAENPGVVTEYDAKGAVVWEYPINTRVYGAIRLKNGNTLIASGGGAGVVELTRDNKVVWEIKNKIPDTPITLKWTTFLTELDNGNFIVGNCHAGEKSPQLFEITRDRKVVWQFNRYDIFGNGLACSQVLDDKQSALVRKRLAAANDTSGAAEGTGVQTKNWPQFRGPAVDGLGEGATLPDTWSATENVVWKTELPGWGWSSPVVWEKRIFVTAAVHGGPRDKMFAGGYPGGFVKPLDEHQWMVFCVDFDSGKILWQREAHKGLPPQPRHPRNSYASETPVTDGERVYAYFADVGLFCYDMDGKPLWEKRWDAYPIRGGWGTGISPVLHKDRLYIVNDNEKESFMVALDKTTGKQLWRTARAEKSNWATPYVWENDKRTEIVTIGTNRARSYDLDGKVLWELSGTSGLVSQIPMSKHGLLYLGAGYHYGPLYAIRPGAMGDISLKEGETSNASIAWSQPRGSSIHPGYLISGDRLYVLFDAGLVSCSSAKTGESIFPRERLNTGGGRFYASPWAYNGKVFLLNEDGTTYVIDDAAKFNLVRKNSLDDYAWATPAISQGSLILRTYTKLFRLQKKSEKQP